MIKFIKSKIPVILIILLTIAVTGCGEESNYNSVGNLFEDGLLAAESNGEWGYIDKKGEYVVKPRFDKVWNFSEGLAGVRPSFLQSAR